MDKLEFYTRTNPETGKEETAVLYSRGYGAGWSTWSSIEIALDKRVIEHVIEHSDLVLDSMDDVDCEYDGTATEMMEFLATLGYENVYCGGIDGLTLAWLPKGVAFRINEYDGAESIEVLDMSDWWVI